MDKITFHNFIRHHIPRDTHLFTVLNTESRFYFNLNGHVYHYCNKGFNILNGNAHDDGFKLLHFISSFPLGFGGNIAMKCGNSLTRVYPHGLWEIQTEQLSMCESEEGFIKALVTLYCVKKKNSNACTCYVNGVMHINESRLHKTENKYSCDITYSKLPLK